LSVYTTDFVLLPLLFLVFASGASAWLRDRVFALEPGLGHPLADDALRVFAYAITLATVSWLVVLVPGLLISLDLRRAAGQRPDPGIELWGRIGMLPTLAFGAGGFALAFYAIVWTTPAWWLLVACAMALLSVIYFSRVLRDHRERADHVSVPGRLRERFAGLARLAGAPQVLIATSRTKKPSAFTFGFGAAHTVVISQDVISRMDERELDIVMAHEIGHVANRDLLRKIAMQGGLALVGLMLLATLLESVVGRFGIVHRWDVATLPLVFLYLRLASLSLSPIANYHSQRRELAADRFALSIVGDPVAYISAQKRLADLDFVDSDSTLFSRLYSTHPSLKSRLGLVSRGEEATWTDRKR
jgi:STE24 endopeptidase